jgi:hypothetical protein
MRRPATQGVFNSFDRAGSKTRFFGLPLPAAQGALDSLGHADSRLVLYFPNVREKKRCAVSLGFVTKTNRPPVPLPGRKTDSIRRGLTLEDGDKRMR